MLTYLDITVDRPLPAQIPGETLEDAFRRLRRDGYTERLLSGDGAEGRFRAALRHGIQGLEAERMLTIGEIIALYVAARTNRLNELTHLVWADPELTYAESVAREGALKAGQSALLRHVGLPTDLEF